MRNNGKIVIRLNQKVHDEYNLAQQTPFYKGSSDVLSLWVRDTVSCLPHSSLSWVVYLRESIILLKWITGNMNKMEVLSWDRDKNVT